MLDKTEIDGTIKKRKVIIDDVAKEAGVSKTTVSRVMNYPHLVHDSTVQKVKKAINKLNYMPNTVAQSMRSKRTKTIAVVIPDIKNPFYSGMIAEIETAVRAYDYMLIICPTSGVFEEEKEYVLKVLQRRVDGILHFTYNNSQKHINEILSITKKLPFILMDEPTDELQVNQVITNGYAGVIAAVDHFVAKGHTKIACVSSRTEAASKRLLGYEDALKKHGIRFRKDYLVPSGFSVEEGKDAGKRIVQLSDRPTAIICVADTMAVGVLKQLNSSGIKIPEEIEIIGFNNSELSTFTTPTLSSIGQNTTELAKQAVKLMMDMIKTPSRNHTVKIIKVESELVFRETTN